ncbi:MAG: hypothetical protein ABI859_09390 [Pseudomonadota bacterium]
MNLQRIVIGTAALICIPCISTALADEPVAMVRLTASEVAAQAAAAPANPTGPQLTARVAIPARTQVKPRPSRPGG